MKLNFKDILQKIKQPFLQGLSARELIKAIIVSVLFTIIPVFGVTSILLVFVAIRFKLNLPLMVMVSYIATPLQFMLFLPFIHIGETILNANHTLLTVQKIKNAFDISFWNTVNQLIFELICGISGWVVFALPISFITIVLSDKMFKLIKGSNATH